MIAGYEYLFYKLYQWSIKINGENFFHKFHATLMISLVLAANIASLYCLVEILSGGIFSNNSYDIGELEIVFISVAYYFFHYLFFSYHDRHLRILEKYKNEPNANRGNVIVVLYTVVSFMFLISTWIIGLMVME